ncbi:Death on curing protein, Doc toxin [Desulfovibrio sp. DV]|uniref:type II toxin-antitoxin system RelE/ParE family toxin n=1 Tax=Desulfovibrio sp. DV TaxID=1844708 RepID=UPI00094BB091|nr:type II toxin-antitoxin system RelE/ParE family toxin [Desulfovibrio sp. DV]OLN26064.1 Death on curing protein, Doc toxin [Desulfovibrio sp. DV]
MSYAIVLTADAANDLREIDAYIAWKDSREAACAIVEALQDCVAGLVENPGRGNFPKELLEFGIREFREVHYRQYRILYRISDRTVYILCVADGRRDMPRLLMKRLIQPGR